MCILSLFRSQEAFVLTHNRDEDYRRQTSETLITKEIKGVSATYPVDILSGGTWILTSEKFTTAILNGADRLHHRTPPYRHSRGLFPFMLLEAMDTEHFFEHLDLTDIEPFTQLILDHKDLSVTELQWDGSEKMIREISDKLYVTSSATLYTAETRQGHKNSFLGLNDPEPANLAQMHKTLKWVKNPDLAVIKTTSITQIIQNSELKSMKFERMTKNMES